jgi:hypothetical protein
MLARDVDPDGHLGHLGLGGQRGDVGDGTDRRGLPDSETTGDDDLYRERWLRAGC